MACLLIHEVLCINLCVSKVGVVDAKCLYFVLVRFLGLTSRGRLSFYLGGLSRHHVMGLILEVLVHVVDVGFWWLLMWDLLVIDGLPRVSMSMVRYLMAIR